MSIESSGADYLRRLKEDQQHTREVQRPTSSPTILKPVASPALPEPAADPSERRRSPRYKCEGSAEFRVSGSDVRTWGTLTDLSLHGCYVEMTATFPAGSVVDLGLELNGIRAHVLGEVRVSYPCLGMGIAFRDVSREDQQRLGEMVERLAPLRAVMRSAEPEAFNGQSLPMVVDAEAALRALKDFFETRGLMTKADFIRVLRRGQGV